QVVPGGVAVQAHRLPVGVFRRGRRQARLDAVGREQPVDIVRGEIAPVERLRMRERACVQLHVGKCERSRGRGDAAGGEGGQGSGGGQQQARSSGREEAAAVGR